MAVYDGAIADYQTSQYLLVDKQSLSQRRIVMLSIQVRGTGSVVELTEAEIAEFYRDEPLFAKIRSKICRCGERVEWNNLKSKHDQVLNEFHSQKNELLQGANQ